MYIIYIYIYPSSTSVRAMLSRLSGAEVPLVFAPAGTPGGHPSK